MTRETTTVPAARERLDERRRALAEAYIPFARALARRRTPKGGDFARYESAALLGLVQAAARWDPAAGVKFATWAARRIEGAFLPAARKARVPMRSLRDDPMDRRAADPSDGEDAGDARETLAALLALVPDHHQRLACWLVFGEGYSYQSAARELATSKSTVKKRVQAALVVLRRKLEVAVTAPAPHPPPRRPPTSPPRGGEGGRARRGPGRSGPSPY